MEAGYTGITKKCGNALYLYSSFLVLVLMGYSVDLQAMGFEGAPLRERLFAESALVGSHT